MDGEMKGDCINLFCTSRETCKVLLWTGILHKMVWKAMFNIQKIVFLLRLLHEEEFRDSFASVWLFPLCPAGCPCVFTSPLDEPTWLGLCQCVSAGPLLCVLGVGRHFSQLDYDLWRLPFFHFKVYTFHLPLWSSRILFFPIFNVVPNAELVQHCSSGDLNALTLDLDRL